MTEIGDLKGFAKVNGVISKEWALRVITPHEGAMNEGVSLSGRIETDEIKLDIEIPLTEGIKKKIAKEYFMDVVEAIK